MAIEKYNIFGIRPKYFLWGFAILLFSSIFIEKKDKIMFFQLAALILFSLFVACLSYKYSPYFISRREKYIKSAYEIFVKRIFMSFMMAITSIWLILFLISIIFPKESPSIESSNEVNQTVEPVLAENEEKAFIENPILKEDTLLDISPIIENFPFEVKELPMPGIEETTTIEPERIMESPIINSPLYE